MLHSVNFDQELKRKKQEVEEIIFSFLPSEDDFAGELAVAMNYSMRAGGKRLRPILMREACRLFETPDDEKIGPFLAAIEMIHTHSLIHDDLPAIDNDMYRRGRLTTHAVYGEALGVLSGDALLNYAYETAVQAYQKGLEADRVLGALTLLLRKTGMYGMLGGQSVDVTNEKNNRRVNKETLDYIYENKTSALLEASLGCGAILGGAPGEMVDALIRIGSATGIAFQIQDDILDVTSTMEELGKPVFSDEKNEKVTYVTLYGVEGAGREVSRLTEQALCLYEEIGGNEKNPFLGELIRSLAARKN